MPEPIDRNALESITQRMQQRLPNATVVHQETNPIRMPPVQILGSTAGTATMNENRRIYRSRGIRWNPTETSNVTQPADRIASVPVESVFGLAFDRRKELVILDRVILIRHNNVENTPNAETDEMYVVEYGEVRKFRAFAVEVHTCDRIDFHLDSINRYLGYERALARRKFSILADQHLKTGYTYLRDTEMLEEFIMRHPEFQTIGNGQPNPTRGIPLHELDVPADQPRRIIDLS